MVKQIRQLICGRPIQLVTRIFTDWVGHHSIPLQFLYFFLIYRGKGIAWEGWGEGLPYKSDRDACRLSYRCKLQIVVPLTVFGMESHCICSFGYRLELCIKIFPKRLWCLLVWSPLEVSLSLSRTDIGPPLGFNVIFPMSSPLTFIWESPPGRIAGTLRSP